MFGLGFPSTAPANGTAGSRRRTRHPIAGLLAGVLWGASAAALVAVVCAFPPEARSETVARALPWHFSDVYFDFANPVAFRSLSTSLTIDGKAEPSQRLYFAFYGKIGDSAFYFGLQTDLDDPRTRGGDGQGAIFSRWGGTSLEDARIPKGSWGVGLTDKQSGEGDFISVRRSYRWTPGTYRFRLDGEPDATGQTLWVRLTVRRDDEASWTEVGSLRFKDTDSTFRGPLVTFVERYGSSGAGFAKTYSPPPLNVRFDTPQVEGFTALTRVTAYAPRAVPHWANVRWNGAGIDVAVRRNDPIGTEPIVSDKATADIVYDRARRMEPLTTGR